MNHRRHRRWPTLLAGLCLTAPAAPSLAQDQQASRIEPSSRNYLDVEVDGSPPATERRLQYALGVALTSAPEYAGSNRRGLSLKPIAAIRYGRFKISSSGGSSILNYGESADVGGSGASADLIDQKRFKLKLSARIGGGRDTADSVDLAGLPDIDRTVFARLYVSYDLTEHLNLNSGLPFDLLGHGNGATLSAGLGYTDRLSSRTEWTTGIGVGWANATHMQSMFGVPASAATAQRPAYETGAGIKDIGVGIKTALNDNWIAFASTSYARLLGAAADSPLTTGNGGLSATIGIGYRCCKTR